MKTIRIKKNIEWIACELSQEDFDLFRALDPKYKEARMDKYFCLKLGDKRWGLNDRISSLTQEVTRDEFFCFAFGEVKIAREPELVICGHEAKMEGSRIKFGCIEFSEQRLNGLAKLLGEFSSSNDQRGDVIFRYEGNYVTYDDVCAAQAFMKK